MNMSDSSDQRSSSDHRSSTACPALPQEAVLAPSTEVPDGKPVAGYDFRGPAVDYDALFASYATTGFQATALADGVEEIKRMIAERNGPVQLVDASLECFSYPPARRKRACTIFLAYTSNLVSAGLRESIRFLVQNNMVDCLVTSAGGVEEDFIKCMAPTYLGAFHLKGAELRRKGLNRTGNLLVPNSNYCLFEDWVMPLLDRMREEQSRDGTTWSPSEVIKRLGKEIDHPDSIYYWAYKNDIPVFCPGITDGSLGDMLYFHSYRNPGLVIDVVQDIRRINDMAVQSIKTGMIILGGGLIKHHTCNANLMRNGADYAVYVNTGQEFDGSDAGARPDEAVSWGKIKADATPVKIYCDATIAFPILVAQTFAKSLMK